MNQEFYSGDEDDKEKDIYEFRPWGQLKGLCFDLIKGRRTPLFFRFVLHLMPHKAAALLEKENCDVPPDQVKALVLNIRYDGAKATLTTGTASPCRPRPRCRIPGSHARLCGRCRQCR